MSEPKRTRSTRRSELDEAVTLRRVRIPILDQPKPLQKKGKHRSNRLLDMIEQDEYVAGWHEQRAAAIRARVAELKEEYRYLLQWVAIEQWQFEEMLHHKARLKGKRKAQIGRPKRRAPRGR